MYQHQSQLFLRDLPWSTIVVRLIPASSYSPFNIPKIGDLGVETNFLVHVRLLKMSPDFLIDSVYESEFEIVPGSEAFMPLYQNPTPKGYQADGFLAKIQVNYQRFVHTIFFLPY